RRLSPSFASPGGHGKKSPCPACQMMFESVVPMKKAHSIFACLCLLLAGFTTAASGGSVPPGTSIDNQASASYLPSSGPATSANSNVVHVITQASASGAILAVTKTVSKPAANPGDQLTYTLNVSNTGSSDAAPVAVTIDGLGAVKIILRDIIPNNTRFSGFVSAGSSTPLYHIFGAPVQSYASTAPSDLSTVDAVAFPINTFVSGARASFSFTLTVA